MALSVAPKQRIVLLTKFLASHRESVDVPLIPRLGGFFGIFHAKIIKSSTAKSTMPQIILIDENDCFDKIKERVSTTAETLKPSYFLAPDKSFLPAMIEECKSADIVMVHRHIWLDDCHKDDEPCNGGLEALRKAISPIPMIEVGGEIVNNESCPDDMLAAFEQIDNGFKTLGGLIGAKVKHPSPAYSSTTMMVTGLEMLGDSTIGAILTNPAGESRKYFRLSSLEPA